MSAAEKRARNGVPYWTVDRGTADVVIERYGKPIATLIPYADYEALSEYLENLRDVRFATAALEEYRKDPSSDRPWKKLKAN